LRVLISPIQQIKEIKLIKNNICSLGFWNYFLLLDGKGIIEYKMVFLTHLGNLGRKREI